MATIGITTKKCTENDSMKILVTGANGQLGYDFVKEIGIEAIGIDITDLDITDKSATFKFIEKNTS